MTRTKRNARTASITRNFANLRNATIATVDSIRASAVQSVGAARARTAGAVTGLERAFEHRVSKAASRLGLTSAKEVHALARQVAGLEAKIARLRRARA